MKFSKIFITLFITTSLFSCGVGSKWKQEDIESFKKSVCTDPSGILPKDKVESNCTCLLDGAQKLYPDGPPFLTGKTPTDEDKKRLTEIVTECAKKILN